MKRKNLLVKLNPIGNLQLPESERFNGLPSGSCSAMLFTSSIEWNKKNLQIKWNSLEKNFEVLFKGESKENISLDMRWATIKILCLRLTIIARIVKHKPLQERKVLKE